MNQEEIQNQFTKIYDNSKKITMLLDLAKELSEENNCAIYFLSNEVEGKIDA